MQISKKALEEFKRIYKKEFGDELSDDKANLLAQASEIASRVIRLFMIIAQPLPGDKDK